MSLIFVYGTLKRGGSNHDCLKGQRFVAVARTQPAFYLYELDGYPGLVLASDGRGRSIEGEIWDVNAACLIKLDLLEGIAENVYIRALIPLLPPHDQDRVFGYLYQRSVENRRDLGETWPI
jgi:gamma-glutamylaminecyclotransferase